MKKLSIKQSIVKGVFFFCTLTAFPVFAEPPVLQVPTPVIYLADNLDEKDKLGWCIDTLGNGFAENLHAHSCKPSGGDVQFTYDAESLHIVSVEFSDKCVTLNENPERETDFALLDCLTGDANQSFTYDDDALLFHPEENDSYCIAVGDASQSAGPYMSRALELVTCEESPLEQQQWIIKEAQ